MIDDKKLVGLSKRQRDILKFIIKFQDKRGYPPAIRDIGKGVGLSSSSTVHSHLTTLEERGFIRRDPSTSRGIEVLINKDDESEETAAEAVETPENEKTEILIDCPLIRENDPGSKPGEDLPEKLPLPESVVGRPDAFLFKMTSESMVDAGILPGDLCIIHPPSGTEEMKDGDTVLAASGVELYVMRVYQHSNAYRLEPANRRMNVVYFRNLEIFGKVKGIIRSPYIM